MNNESDMTIFVLVLQFLVLVLLAVDLCAEGLLLDVGNPLALQQVLDDQQNFINSSLSPSRMQNTLSSGSSTSYGPSYGL